MIFPARNLRLLQTAVGLRVFLSCVPQLKSCLLCLAALRGSTDPLMYFLLDKTFRHQTRRVLGRRGSRSGTQTCESITGRVSQLAGQPGDTVAATASVDLCH